MQTVIVEWLLPDTRESGRPLPIEQIDFARIEISADEGVTYGLLGEFTPDVLSTQAPDLEPGKWFFRGFVVDKAGRVSKPVVDSIVVEDDSPPGTLTLVLSL